MSFSFYWHDYETFGVNPALDWPAQFAGIRTDAELNVIGEPLNIFCCLPQDHLPNPQACLITHLTPDRIKEKALVEAEFIRQIQQEFMIPSTCVVGYNNFRFDDEVTRNALYRNFYDPYKREYTNNNSRWDLIDLVRATAALRPDEINWLFHDNGLKSLKLEDIATANKLNQSQAHNALSDVQATLELARLLKNKKPKLFNYYLTLRNKNTVNELLMNNSVLVHCSSKFGAAKQYTSFIHPICQKNNNQYIVYNLAVDPTPILEMTIADLKELLFTPKIKDRSHTDAVSLKLVHMNKCPFLVKPQVLSPEDIERLNLDVNSAYQYYNLLKNNSEFQQKVKEAFNSPFPVVEDPDQALYSGGFFSNQDRQCMNKIISEDPKKLGTLKFQFEDSRLVEMLFRYRGRNYPETLSGDERSRWLHYCKKRLSISKGSESNILGFESFWAHWMQLQPKPEDKKDEKKISCLKELECYVDQLQTYLQQASMSEIMD